VLAGPQTQGANSSLVKSLWNDLLSVRGWVSSLLGCLIRGRRNVLCVHPMVDTFPFAVLGSVATRKLHLSAVRGFFDRLVLRHALVFNPAASMRGERLQVLEGKTPMISAEQIRRLIESLDLGSVVGLRDRAVLGVLSFTAARCGAVASLRVGSLRHDGTQYALRFSEKGGKVKDVPLRHDLEGWLLEYTIAEGEAT
jgi:site-specific recombinase XerC